MGEAVQRARRNLYVVAAVLALAGVGLIVGASPVLGLGLVAVAFGLVLWASYLGGRAE